MQSISVDVPRRSVIYKRFGSQTVPVMPARSFIPGRAQPTFPEGYNLQPRRLTFRKLSEMDGVNIEAFRARDVAAARKNGDIMLVLVTPELEVSDASLPFRCGRTLVLRDGKVYSFQLVIFPAGAAVSSGSCDQGEIYAVAVENLSAWSGLAAR